jgi:hypothetical protein
MPARAEIHPRIGLTPPEGAEDQDRRDAPALSLTSQTSLDRA